MADPSSDSVWSTVLSRRRLLQATAALSVKVSMPAILGRAAAQAGGSDSLPLRGGEILPDPDFSLLRPKHPYLIGIRPHRVGGAPRARARADCQPLGTEISYPQLRPRRRWDHLELRMCERRRRPCPHLAAGHRSNKAHVCCSDRERRYRSDGRERVTPTMAAVEDYGLCQGAGRSSDDLVQSRRTVRTLRHLRGI